MDLGGTLYVYSGGTTHGAHINSGGVGHTYASGVDSSTTIAKGGVQYVDGASYRAQVYGNEYISGGGLGYGDTVHNGGREYVLDNAVTSGEVLSSGGSAVVSSGGLIEAGVVMSGGTLTVSLGGVATGGLTISGGTADIYGSASNRICFGGSGGDLALYNLAAFHSNIGGFSAGDEFDLGGFAYGAGETEVFRANANHTQGSLTVTDGAHVAKLTLLGNYLTSDFALSSDHHGGTFVKFA